MYTLDGQPKTWRRRWTGCSFFSIRFGRQTKPKRDVVRPVAPEEAPPGTGMVALPGKFSLLSRIKEFERALRNGSLCSLTCLGVLHPPGPRQTER